MSGQEWRKNRAYQPPQRRGPEQDDLNEMRASLHSEIERRDAALHRRLANVEATLARLDERTQRVTKR